VNACANAGKPALAMLVSSEGINMDRERPASAQRTEGVRSALPATTSSRFAVIGFKMNSPLATLEMDLSQRYPLV
jgi:hypothetical protein